MPDMRINTPLLSALRLYLARCWFSYFSTRFVTTVAVVFNIPDRRSLAHLNTPVKCQETGIFLLLSRNPQVDALFFFKTS